MGADLQYKLTALYFLLTNWLGLFIIQYYWQKLKTKTALFRAVANEKSYETFSQLYPNVFDHAFINALLRFGTKGCTSYQKTAKEDIY